MATAILVYLYRVEKHKQNKPYKNKTKLSKISVSNIPLK